MPYFVFKNIYFFAKKKMEENNRIRIEKQTLPTGVLETAYPYLDSGNQLHQFNLYKMDGAEDTGELPLIIDIHGGGWICGDKDLNSNFNYHLVLKGYNVSSLSYRTIDHCTIREQIKDIFDYFHFLKDNGGRLGISFHKVVLTGDSAGGQLALLVYCINQNMKLQKLFSVAHVDMDVKCLILNHSVCYIDEAGSFRNNPFLSRLVSGSGLQRMIYGKGFLKEELYLNTFNPTRYIFRETAMAPVLLITSKGDTAFSYQTIKLYDYLTELGKDCELYLEESVNAKHVFNIAYPDSAEGKKCNDYIHEYISARL